MRLLDYEDSLRSAIVSQSDPSASDYLLGRQTRVRSPPPSAVLASSIGHDIAIYLAVQSTRGTLVKLRAPGHVAML